MLELLLAAILIGAPIAGQDTLIQVREGDRLVLVGFSGAVEVEGWDRREIRAEAEADGALLFRFSRSGSRIELELLDRKNRNRAEELRLLLPAWMDLDVSGAKLDVEVRGLRGEVRVRNLKGDLVLQDLSGLVDASSVEGSIEAVGLDGAARLKTGDDDILIVGSGADLNLESVSGDIELERSSSREIEVHTTDGDVDFSGVLLPGGSYAFHSHGGDVTLTLESPVDADVSALVYEGEFESDFPIRAGGFQSGHEFRFTIGEGGARVLLEAFDGEVKLRRGEAGGGGETAAFTAFAGGRASDGR